MLFHSAGFLFLLVATVLAYYAYQSDLLSRRRAKRRTEYWQHFVLTIASLVFYWFAGPVDLAILLGTVLINHVMSAWGWGRVVAIVVSVGVLGWFKYVYFLGGLLGVTTAAPISFAIPLGISFYIFQLIAYQVDLRRGVVEREPSFFRLLLYVLFFPHHQAGPIMRPAAFIPQFYGAKPWDAERVTRGLRWILYGLVLKVTADQVGEVVTPLFARAPTSVAEAWAAPLGFAVQIYGDFAGYSGMAIGLALLFGYELDRNFNQPYLARSPSEFWTRWHITLSAWFRDYVYIPLGGNREGRARTYLNLLLTMTIAGLWHGPSWNFVLWGALHGLVLCAFRLLRLERLPGAIGWLVTQASVVALWVPFRAVTLGDTLAIWRAMVGLGVPAGSASAWLALAVGAAMFLAFHLGEEAALGSPDRSASIRERWLRVPPMARGALAASVLIVTVLFLQEKTTFIYFRF